MQDLAFVYSCIAFSIVFIVLSSFALLVCALRLLNVKETRGGSSSAPNEKSVVKAELHSAADVKSRHVAAITAAILAATGGRGRVLSVTPIVTPVGRTISSESTKMWRMAAIMATASRRLAPSWKR